MIRSASFVICRIIYCEFKATLEETQQADLLLHVADASSPFVEDRLKPCIRCLKSYALM